MDTILLILTIYIGCFSILISKFYELHKIQKENELRKIHYKKHCETLKESYEYLIRSFYSDKKTKEASLKKLSELYK